MTTSAEEDMQSFMLGDGVVVFPSLNRLCVTGQDIHVEPKVMALLEVLAERPQQVVGRPELLDRVWAGTVVGDEALTRCVSQLRSALGDRANQPIFIQTVPKRGYRLLVAPSWGPNRGSIPGPSAGLAPVPPTPSAPPAARASVWLSSALAVLMLTAVALWAGLFPDHPRSIAVLPFDSAALAGIPSRDYFGGGFAEELQSALVGLPQLRVSARRGAGRADAGADVQAIGQTLGVDLILTGSVHRLGDHLRISARLVDVAEGHHLWAGTFEWDEHDVYVLQDAIVASVARALGLEAVEPTVVTRTRVSSIVG